MNRILEPEILDHLPAMDPKAVRSRRDLRRVNWWMGHARILNAIVSPAFGGGTKAKRIVELGAGDGTFLLGLAIRTPARESDIELLLVDRQNIVTPETIRRYARCGWRARGVQADVFAWLEAEKEEADLITANLFLHHFSEMQLARLFASCASRTGFFCGLEPRRTRFAGLAKKLLWMIGCNGVTRHDAFVSIRAGFFGEELSPLWPKDPAWNIREWEAGWFSHALVATKKLSASGSTS